jgi:hypothetical protein
MALAKVVEGIALLAMVAIPGQSRTAVAISCTDLPAKVASIAAKHPTKPGTQRSCERINDDSRILFEVKVVSPGGKMQEYVYGADGSLVEFEEESELAKIPPGARSAIQKAVAKSVLRKVDVIQRGSTKLYEGEYTDAGQKKKIIVDANGAVISN